MDNLRLLGAMKTFDEEADNKEKARKIFEKNRVKAR
jgi:hypothetical protein